MANEISNDLKVIFIASLGHSGSTLLDLMLNAHPDVTSVGELKQLSRLTNFDERKRHHSCTCGAKTLMTCDFWSRVSGHTETAVGRTIAQLNVEDYEARETFATDNVVLFKAISEVSGNKFVVDSSKESNRLKLLLEVPSLSVFPIFLLRDPKGQICSLHRKYAGDLRRLAAKYVRTNREIYALVSGRDYAIVRYEELVLNPERILTKLMRALGLSFHPLQFQWASQERHNVGGNRMRRGSSSELKLDESWRNYFNLLQKLTIDAYALPGRYPFVKFNFPGNVAV